MKLAINLYIKNLGNALTTALVQSDTIKPENTVQIVNSIQENVEKKIEKSLPKLYTKFKKHFEIPANIVLPENFSHEKMKNKDVNDGVLVVKELEAELMQLKCYREKLSRELMVFEMIKSFLEEEMDLIDAVQEIVTIANGKSYENNQELLKKIKIVTTEYLQ